MTVNRRTTPLPPVQDSLDVADVTPSADDLAALLRARTDDGRGNEGAWSDLTRPTLTEVERLLRLAVTEILGRTGSNVNAAHYEQFKLAALFRAAQLVEQSYYPEQANQDQSAYQLFSALAIEHTNNLAELVQHNDPTAKRPRFFSIPLRSVAYREPDLWTSD